MPEDLNEPIVQPQEDHEDAINRFIKGNNLETNRISDGYHTFGELYEHRIVIFIALCKSIKLLREEQGVHGTVWRSLKHSDGELAYGGTWFVLGINTEPGQQITYHLPIEKWDECYFAAELEVAPEFDGHTSADVLERLKLL